MDKYMLVICYFNEIANAFHLFLRAAENKLDVLLLNVKQIRSFNSFMVTDRICFGYSEIPFKLKFGLMECV